MPDIDQTTPALISKPKIVVYHFIKVSIIITAMKKTITLLVILDLL